MAVDGGGADVIAVADAGVDAPVIVDRPTPMDAPVAVADAGPMDTGAAGTDVGAPRDVDPRQSEVCRGITATCDGRTVNVQGGERDGGAGRTYHCGGCGITCEPGSFCVNCVCAR